MLPDSADLDTYGGPIKNYSPVIDPTTDEAAIFRNTYVVDGAGMTHTAARGFISFRCVNGANPTEPSPGHVEDTVWGNTVLAYKSAVTRSTEGVWLITLPVEVQQVDIAGELAEVGGGVTTSINVRRAYAQIQCSDGTLRHARAEVLTANTIKVRTWLGTALDDCPGEIVTCWFY